MKESYKKCKDRHEDCFAYKRGLCILLTDTNFGKRSCPFYKPREQYENEIKASNERMKGKLSA